MPTTKITQLTGSQVEALQIAQSNFLLTEGTEITATTATFPNNAYTAASLVRNAKSFFVQYLGFSANTHPAKSLSAVIRKLEAQLERKREAG